jgi:hypothetical protein
VHRALLRAALLDDAAAARAAYAEWAGLVDIRALDYGAQTVLPLLHRRLHRLGLAQRHVGIVTGAYRRARYANRLLLRRSINAIEALRNSDIDHVAVRGLALLAVVRDDIAVRAIPGADIVVRPAHVEAALAALAHEGWRPRYDERLDAGVLRARDDWPLFDSDGVQLHLRWRWPHASDAGADVAPWDAAEIATLDGRAIRVSGRSDLLLDTCMHAAGWNTVARLGSIADAALIVRHELDWARVVRLARAFAVVPAIRATLADLRDLLGAPVPPRVLAELAAAPTAVRDRLELYCRRAAPPRLHPVVDTWFGYARTRRAAPDGMARLGLLRYLQLRWSLRAQRHVPLAAAWRLARALRGTPAVRLSRRAPRAEGGGAR